MSTSHLKSQRKCSTCGANLHVRKDVTTTEGGQRRIDTMLVCPDESCTQPTRHLHTEHPQPA